MTDAATPAWPETLKVLEEAEVVTELNARLVGLRDAFKESGEGVGVESAKILSFLENHQPGVFDDLPPVVRSKLRDALTRMAANDPAAKELLAKL
jgi:hypothetical protein